MTFGILQQISQQPPQQARIAVDFERLTFQLHVIVTGAFLGGEREQINLFAYLVLDGVQPAGQQYFVDQLVQLSNILFQARLGFGIRRCLEHFQSKPDARQRRSQLMRRIGEKGLMRAYQLLNPAGRAVETLRQSGHFIVAFHGNTSGKVAGAQRINAALQAFETAAQLSHNGKRRQADAYGGENQEQVKIQA